MQLRDFYDYHIWSYLALIDHLEKDLPQVLFTEKVESSFSTISQTLDHIYQTDCRWYEVLQGHNPSFMPEDAAEHHDLQTIKEQFVRLHDEISRFLSEHGAELEREVRFKNNRGGETLVTLEEVVLTLVNHGSYHRGAIAAILRQLGYSSISSDYLFYLKNRKRRF
ncbi:DinB family protein [Paenibacillus abyssi]|uniref:Protein DinB n=1 Tax=Paenibacillus abyssi TaxID=1340531 RepID=A0A917LD86_9BACL|nr:DinB family protein [Paenibacillus abyssi]GGG14922.1 protein DinB [Paenibacillus abyssi]